MQEREKLPVKKYKTIMADPPWEEKGGGKIKRGADRHYDVLKNQQIIGMAPSIKKLIHEDGCHLYLWVTNNFLEAGLEVMKAWGFDYITQITWCKRTAGLGQYFRGMSEPCLFGATRPRLPYKKKEGKRCQHPTIFFADEQWEKGRRHSEKPPEIFEIAEHVSYGNRLEIFSRCPRDGWDVWGNEVETDIEIIIPPYERKSRKKKTEKKGENLLLL